MDFFSQDSTENVDSDGNIAKKRKKTNNSRKPWKELNWVIDKNKDVELKGKKKKGDSKETKDVKGTGLRGGIEKGRTKVRNKRDYTQIEVHVVEMDKTTNYKIPYGKYRSMQDLIDDLKEHIEQQSQIPFINHDGDSRFMLVDPINNSQITSVDRLKNSQRYRFVHVRDYRRRDIKLKNKEMSEEEDDGEGEGDDREKGRLFDAIECKKGNNVKGEEWKQNSLGFYVGPGNNLPPELKSEVDDRQNKLGNLIQGSYGMGYASDKLKQFSQTNTHLLQKLAPGYMNYGKYESYGANFQQTKLEQMNISGTNYSVALVHFVLSFKMANDILVMEPGEDNFFSSISEDPRDVLEYMTLFQEYLKIGWDLQKIKGPDSLTKWDDQKKVLRILGHNSQVVRNGIMKEVRSKHSFETPNSKELIFTVAKSKEELKEIILKHSNKRGYRIVSETWHDPKGNTQNLQFCWSWKGRGAEGELLKWRFYLKFKYISDKFSPQDKSNGRFIIDEYQLLHCHQISEKVENPYKFEEPFPIDKISQNEKNSISIQWDINIDRSLDRLYLYKLVTNQQPSCSTIESLLQIPDSHSPLL